jgi:tRNA pseudouridine32 synthase/23S rRNA pseudouridine746 synthase
MPNKIIPIMTYTPPMDPYLPIVHADDHVMVVNKPTGLLSVMGRDPKNRDSVATRAREVYDDARIVHRLDMPTSGLLVLGRGVDAHRHLSMQFQNRQTDKVYIADIWGMISDDTGEVDVPLIADWDSRPLQKVCFDTGKTALTRWEVIARYPDENYTRVKLLPHTGRSHQLRVHMMHIGHPILGDEFYANGDAMTARERLALHAHTLSFFHPDGGRRVSFEAPIPF